MRRRWLRLDESHRSSAKNTQCVAGEHVRVGASLSIIDPARLRSDSRRKSNCRPFSSICCRYTVLVIVVVFILIIFVVVIVAFFIIIVVDIVIFVVVFLRVYSSFPSKVYTYFSSRADRRRLN